MGELAVANTKSAKKRAIQNETRRKHNAALKSAYRTSLKKVEAAIASNNKEDAVNLFKNASRILDKTVTKGILHKNTANRYKSRLGTKVKNTK
jgi:small subunit ribosomal protein S20